MFSNWKGTQRISCNPLRWGSTSLSAPPYWAWNSLQIERTPGIFTARSRPWLPLETSYHLVQTLWPSHRIRNHNIPPTCCPSSGSCPSGYTTTMIGFEKRQCIKPKPGAGKLANLNNASCLAPRARSDFLEHVKIGFHLLRCGFLSMSAFLFQDDPVAALSRPDLNVKSNAI
jgi:hypothetical protein